MHRNISCWLQFIYSLSWQSPLELGSLGASQVMLVKKEPSCQSRRYKGYRFNSWVGKIPLRRSWQPTPVFLPGESHGQRRLAAYSPWDHKESITAKETWHAGKHSRA